MSAGRTHSAVIDGKSDTALFIIGGFPLSRNLKVLTLVNFTPVNLGQCMKCRA